MYMNLKKKNCLICLFMPLWSQIFGLSRPEAISSSVFEAAKYFDDRTWVHFVCVQNASHGTPV